MTQIVFYRRQAKYEIKNNNDGTYKIHVKTEYSNITDYITLDTESYRLFKEWVEGSEHIQITLKRLTENDREYLLSGLKGTDFDNVFPQDE